MTASRVRLMIAAVLAGFVMSCGGSPAAPTPTVTAVAVTGSSPLVGSTSQFTATARLSNGKTQEVTGAATWQSSNTNVATVTAGMVKGLAAGEADISAAYQNITGSTHLAVAAPAPTIVKIVVSGVPAVAGSSAPFSATATLSDGTTQDVTGHATWSSSNAAVATAANGTVTSVAPGEADISATWQNFTGTLHVTIMAAPPTVTTVSVSGTAPGVGASSRFIATATLSDGTTQDVTTQAAWASSNTAVATVVNGSVTGVAAGETDVAATYGNVTGKLHVTIAASTPAVRVTAVSVNGAATLTVSGSARFTATATLSNGTTQDITSSAAWRTSNSAVATVTSTGTVYGIAAGQADITAVYESVTGSVRVTVTAISSCNYQVLSSPIDVASFGGTYYVYVIANPKDCTWTATSSDPFITFTSATSGTGDATIPFSVAANFGPARTATLTVAGQRVTVNQPAGSCVTSVSTVNIHESAEFRSLVVTVTAPPTCSWTATTASSYISIQGTGGTGNGSFTFYLSGNLTGSDRIAAIQVGHWSIRVFQEAQAPIGGTFLSFVSDAGDPIGLGQTQLWQSSRSMIYWNVDAHNHLSIGVEGSDSQNPIKWTLDLAAPSEARLAPGTYLSAARWPQAPGVPGLYFSGNGRSCTTLTGQFTVTEVVYETWGNVQRLRATFEQHCEGAGPALRGEVLLAR